MRVAVIGAEGFIGSHVMEYLEEKGHVGVGYDYSYDEYATEYIDVRWGKEYVLKEIGRIDPDAVIGLAGLLGTHELFDNVEEAIKVNVTGQYNVAWSAKELGVPYVTIEQPHVWTNPYEATRGAGVRLARSLAAHQGLDLATVQAFNAFGPRQAYGPGHPQKIVPTFAKAALAGEPLPVYGSGGQMVNLVTARDIARVMVRAIPLADPDAPHFYGAAYNGNFTVNKVAHMIQRRVLGQGYEESIEYLDMREGEDDDDLGASMQKSRLKAQQDVMGFMPMFDIQELNDTIDWYRDH